MRLRCIHLHVTPAAPGMRATHVLLGKKTITFGECGNIRTTSIEIELEKRRVIFKHHIGLNAEIYDGRGRIVCCTRTRLMNRTGFRGDTYRTTERFRKNKRNEEQKDDKPRAVHAL